jgi:hypothetical protein
VDYSLRTGARTFYPDRFAAAASPQAMKGPLRNPLSTLP